MNSDQAKKIALEMRDKRVDLRTIFIRASIVSESVSRSYLSSDIQQMQ